MKCVHLLVRLLVTCVSVAILIGYAWAQIPPPAPQPCLDSHPSPYGDPGPACAPLDANFSTAVPLIDGNVTKIWPAPPLPNGQIATLYGAYGNIEPATHFNQGTSQASLIHPLCTDGSLPQNNTCPDGKAPAVVWLFIGFSNCDIEICGGNSDIWDQQDTYQTHLSGQPCATRCPNLNNPDFPNPWNQVTGGGPDGVTQQSFLYQVYPDNNPAHWLVGSHVVVWDGALGQQTLDRWDTTSNGWYWNHNDCTFDQYSSVNPECNYVRVHDDLVRNGYSEKQVQAVFMKTSTEFPQCDLSLQHCNTNITTEPDAFTSERFMGNILRYLKCCKLNSQRQSTGIPRYPNLKQVLMTTRIYGGYANGTAHGCLSPEPFAYEEGFAVQRLIVNQINGTDDGYSGNVTYPTNAPWVDWGPYLWANADSKSPSTGVFWCNGQSGLPCSGEQDFRYGDIIHDPIAFWGDYTHPTAPAAKRVADQLVIFIGKDPSHIKPGSPFVLPWITQ